MQHFITKNGIAEKSFKFMQILLRYFFSSSSSSSRRNSFKKFPFLIIYQKKVFYVDYGTVSEIPKGDVRFLAKEFAKLPSFAHRGCLENLIPKHGSWTIETLKQFASMMEPYRYGGITATVTAINAGVS